MNGKLLNTSAVLLLFAATASWAADDGASLYKKKCGTCHGANGQGKPAIKAPAVKGTSLDADKLAAFLTQGESSKKAPHNKGMSGLTDSEAKAIADYIKTL
jgi:mono/diheme cytochrome c family protein